MCTLNKTISKVIYHKKKIGVLAVGHAFKESTDHLFDYWLYIAVIAFFGTLTGGIIMALLSLLACYLLIIFYDWTKKDWLGIELIKESDFGPDFLKQKSRRSYLAHFFWWPFRQIFRLVKWAQKRGGLAAFAVLSVYTDPFVTTVFLRHKKFGGLKKRDWFVFLNSVIVGNFYWTLRTAVIILVAKLGFNAIF